MSRSSNDTTGPSRRSLLLTAIASSAGLALMRKAGAGDMSLEQAREIIGDRHKTFEVAEDDRRLQAGEIEERVAGNTLYGMLYDDDPFVLSLFPDGTATLVIADRPLDHGRWWIDADNHTISSQWDFAAKSVELKQQYYETGEPGLFKTVTEPMDRWSLFLIEPGIPDEMRG